MAKKAKAKRKQKLKVFRTPIGFHDAYVAAPSQKAALEAWGSDVNLFARGSAEEVTDAKLTREPLESPGIVFRRLRGSGKEQMEALGRDEARRARERKKDEGGSRIKSGMTKERKKGPKPGRAELGRAEEALEKLEARQRRESAALDEKQRKLERERRELERRHARQRQEAQKKERSARKAYEDAMREWERN